jgi:Glyoxalase/Bleomycin resistance protein/Dioxygenase superfamily
MLVWKLVSQASRHSADCFVPTSGFHHHQSAKFARSDKQDPARVRMMRRMKSVLPSKVSIIVLGVDSVTKSVAFYRDTLGMQVNTQSEDLAFVLLSGLTFMLSAELGKAFKPIAGATEIVFPVDSVDVAYRLLSQCGCNFIRHPGK